MNSRTIVFLLTALIPAFFYLKGHSQTAMVILIILGIYALLAIIQVFVFGKKLSFRMFMPEEGSSGEAIPGELVVKNDSWLPVSGLRCVLYAENSPGDWEAVKKRDIALFSKGQKSWLFSVENGEPGAVRLTLDRLEVSDPLGVFKRNVDISDIMQDRDRVRYAEVGGKKSPKGKSYLKLSNRSGGPATRNNTAFSGFLGRVAAAILVGATTFLVAAEMLDMDWSPADAIGARFMTKETIYVLAMAAVCFLLELGHVHIALLIFCVPEVLIMLGIFNGEVHSLSLVMHIVALIVAFCGARSEEVSVSGYIHGLILAGIMLLVVL